MRKNIFTVAVLLALCLPGCRAPQPGDPPSYDEWRLRRLGQLSIQMGTAIGRIKHEGAELWEIELLERRVNAIVELIGPDDPLAESLSGALTRLIVNGQFDEAIWFDLADAVAAWVGPPATPPPAPPPAPVP